MPPLDKQQVDQVDDAHRRASRSGATACKVVDPRTLGRPIHLLHGFSDGLREDISELFRTRLNRRYHASFQVLGTSVDAGGKTAPAGRWIAYGNSIGRIGCAIDRDLVLSSLAYRYGLKGLERPDSDTPEGARETASEERLALRLGLQMGELIAARILADHGDLPSDASHHLVPIGATSPPRSACLVKARIRENTHDVEGHLYLALDDSWLDLLLRKLTPSQHRRSSASAISGDIANQMQIKVVARLLQKDTTVGDLLSIRVGDVIPVSLRTTDVMVGESRLFTAAVAEHKGKLCLTSFEDAK